MSKQKSVIISEDQEKYAKYKWEFLRRNAEYIKDWKNWNEQDSIRPNGQFSKEEIQLCIKWKLGCPLNPENSYEDWINIGSDEIEIDLDIDGAPGRGIFPPLDLRRLMFHWLNPDMLLAIPIRIIDGWEYDHDGDSVHHYVSDRLSSTGRLKIEVDLNFSKSKLFKEFQFLLDEWMLRYEDAYMKKIYKSFCKERNLRSFPIDDKLRKEFEKKFKKEIKQRNKKYKKKYHFGNYDDYLKVYDLKKEGVSWAKIAKTLDLNSVQTARNHYNAACKIIQRGID